MGGIRPVHWALILAHILLLQIQPIKVQGADPVSQKLRRLNEQFQQFQALTQAPLGYADPDPEPQLLWGLESRVQALNDHYHHMSHDLEHLKQSTTQELGSLREWNKKLEKKNKRMEGRMALIERNLRDNCRQFQKQKPDLGQDFSNLTLELQNQEERLAALQIQRDELLIGLKGLQDSLKKQELRVIQLEGRLSENWRWNGGGNSGGLWRDGDDFDSNVAPQEHYDPRKRSQMQRGRRPGGILDGHAQPRTGSFGLSMTDRFTPPQNRAKQPKQTKIQRPRPQAEAHLQRPAQYANPGLHSLDSQPQPGHDLSRHMQHPQSQIQLPAQTRPYPVTQEQLLPKPYGATQHGVLQDRKTQVQLHPKPTKESQTPQHRLPVWDKGREEDSNTKEEPSVIHNFLQLPLRHKIPDRPVVKKDATICNVDSMLFFPSASEQNYVTFSLSLPNLPELSMCLWLRVDTSHVGTLLSYATHDNDNQLVLYGRNSSVSSTSFSASSSSSHLSYSSLFAPKSFPSLDFVIGDPVFRRLPISSLMDSRWHHLCVVWSSIQGRFWHYNNRRLASTGSDFRKGWEIPGGGSVVLGQEQDSVGGGFDRAEGFAGQMAGFRIWDRVLSPSEVEGVAEGRGVPRGVVLGMEDIKQVHGEVQQVACECLEHCL
ncbi:pentraxin-4-like [Sphaeramia orbicularis]|uniref:pentraxin-4-like n=1 Tax=Sphaeramia orbicularis TaxID=375764 RepID=UPI00117E4CCD|nr:pentraxin-4-like [Sphaeramia orbicularis]